MDKNLKISDLKFDDKNANKHTQKGMKLLEKSMQKLGAGRSILIDKDNNIIAGNGVVETAGQIGIEKIKVVETDGNEIIAVKRTDLKLNSKKGRELAIADNQTAKEGIDFDFEMLDNLATDFDIDLKEWDLGINEFGFGNSETISEEEQNNYSRKIKAPIYEPKNDKPLITDVFDEKKTMDLIQEIKDSSIELAEKEFLIKAAQRHRVFNYSKIADYYAHSNKEMQDLMEKSALVIIDFNKAIEYGFVKMTEEIARLYGDNSDD